VSRGADLAPSDAAKKVEDAKAEEADSCSAEAKDVAWSKAEAPKCVSDMICTLPAEMEVMNTSVAGTPAPHGCNTPPSRNARIQRVGASV
jgi:hypothetical protein